MPSQASAVQHSWVTIDDRVRWSFRAADRITVALRRTASAYGGEPGAGYVEHVVGAALADGQLEVLNVRRNSPV